LTDWIDQFPWWAVVLAGFAAGSLIGVYLRRARRNKYKSKET